MKKIVTLLFILGFNSIAWANVLTYKAELVGPTEMPFTVEFTIDNDGNVREVNNPNEVLIERINYFGEYRVFISTTSELKYYSSEFLILGDKLSRSCMVYRNDLLNRSRIISTDSFKLSIWSETKKKYVELIDQATDADRAMCTENLSY